MDEQFSKPENPIKPKRRRKTLSMFTELHNRAEKAGQPPGTLIYTGKEPKAPTNISVIAYSNRHFEEKTGHRFEDCFPLDSNAERVWINVEGLHDVKTIEAIAHYFQLHPLTVEDVLNVGQRPKVEEFDHYIFITMKALFWHKNPAEFSIRQLSFVLAKDFVISFQEKDTDLFESLRNRLKNNITHPTKQQHTDYLLYRLIDAVVDEYFIVLEAMGDSIEKIEDTILSSPTVRKTRTIYQLKRQMLLLRKVIWPVRELTNHLLHIDNPLITKSISIYMRDVYDHVVQGIDTLETFRDMLSSLMDMYLSSLSHRMNEIMKTLTIISTIFIPITAIGSIYGMNFVNLPGIHESYGYLIAAGMMVATTTIMLFYFYRKRWF